MSRTPATITGLLTAALLVAPACDDPPKAETKTAKADKEKPKDKSPEKDAPEKKSDKPEGDAKPEAKAEKPEGDKPEGDAPEGDAGAEGGGGTDAPSVPAGDAGPAYIAVDEKGVFVVDGGEVKKVKKGPDKLVQQMSLGPDGQPYLLGFDGVMKLDKDAAKIVAKTSWKKTGTVDSFALTKDGNVWVAGFKGVAFHDGKKWAAEEKATIGTDVKMIRGIVVDKEDRPWVASSNAVHVKDGDAWKTPDLSKVAERKPFFDSIALDPKSGAVYAAARALLVKASAPDKVEKVAVATSGLSSIGLVSFAQNGIGALKADVKHVARLVDGKQASFEMGKDFPGTRVQRMAVDGKGRVWVATDLGIAVLGPAAERVEWKSGSIPELAGRVRGMVVVGAGPDLPEVGEVKKGILKGKILLDGAPHASADIALCPEPSSVGIKTSPCEDSPVRFDGKTAEDGAFEFKDVPLGAYGLAVKVDDKWKITLSGQFGAKMKEGEALDVGALKFKKK